MDAIWTFSNFLLKESEQDDELKKLLKSLADEIKQNEILDLQIKSEYEENIRLRMEEFHLVHIANQKDDEAEEICKLEDAFGKLQMSQIHLEIQMGQIEFEKIAAYDMLIMQLREEKVVKELEDEHKQRCQSMEKLEEREIVKQLRAKVEELNFAQIKTKSTEDYVQKSRKHALANLQTAIGERNEIIVQLVKGAHELAQLQEKLQAINNTSNDGQEELKPVQLEKMQLNDELKSMEQESQRTQLIKARTMENEKTSKIPLLFFDAENPEDFLKAFNLDFNKNDYLEKIFKNITEKQCEAMDPLTDEPMNIETEMTNFTIRPILRPITASFSRIKTEQHVRFDVPDSPERNISQTGGQQSPICTTTEILDLLTPLSANQTSQSGSNTDSTQETVNNFTNDQSIDILENRLLKPPGTPLQKSFSMLGIALGLEAAEATQAVDNSPVKLAQATLEKSNSDEDKKSRKYSESNNISYESFFSQYMESSLKSPIKEPRPKVPKSDNTKSNELNTSLPNRKQSSKSMLKSRSKTNHFPADDFENFCNRMCTSSPEPTHHRSMGSMFGFFDSNNREKIDEVDDDKIMFNFSDVDDESDNFL